MAENSNNPTSVGPYTLNDAPHPCPDGDIHVVDDPDGTSAILRIPSNPDHLTSERCAAFLEAGGEMLATETPLIVDGETVGFIHRSDTPTDEIEFLQEIETPLESDLLLELLEGLLRTLFRLHGRGLIHGAVIPDTIFKAGDRWMIGFPLLDIQVPTAEWMYADKYRPFIAPDCRDSHVINPLADLYGIAATVLYGALDSTEAIETLLHPRTYHEWDAALKNRGLRPELSGLLAYMLVKDPSDRCQSAFDILNAFRTIPESKRSVAIPKRERVTSRLNRDKRHRCHLESHLWEVDEQTGGDGVSAIILNVSYGGLMLELEEPGDGLALGARVKLQITAPDGSKKKLAGYIRWYSDIDAAYTMGVQLESEDDIAIAREIVELMKLNEPKGELG